MSSLPKIDFTLDVLGELCPRPVVLTQRKFKELSVGQTLLIIADDPGVQVDFPLWCKANQQELVSLERTDRNSGPYHVVLRKK